MDSTNSLLSASQCARLLTISKYVVCSFDDPYPLVPLCQDIDVNSPGELSKDDAMETDVMETETDVMETDVMETKAMEAKTIETSIIDRKVCFVLFRKFVKEVCFLSYINPLCLL